MKTLLIYFLIMLTGDVIKAPSLNDSLIEKCRIHCLMNLDSEKNDVPWILDTLDFKVEPRSRRNLSSRIPNADILQRGIAER